MRFPTGKPSIEGSDLKPDWLKQATNSLAQKIAGRINSAATINPVNLVAMALLSTPRYALGEQELLLQLDTYAKLLKRMPYSDKTVMTELDGRSMDSLCLKSSSWLPDKQTLWVIFFRLEDSNRGTNDILP